MADLTPKQKAGRLGGLATVARYGRGHMAAIGKRGAATLWQRYNLLPYQLSKFALVDRETGKVKAIR
jgi:hypothetical protein